MLLVLYQALTWLGGPLIALHLHRRARYGKEDKNRLAERLGWPGKPRPDGPLLWFHAASVGESLAMLPLLDRLLAERDDLILLVTTGTVTSAKLMAERLPDRVLHQFSPIDRAAAWARFLAHWQPDAGCLVESEIWPNLILEAERQGVPLVVINGRLSERSFKRWAMIAPTARRLFAGFALCFARSGEDGARFQCLGARDVRVLGDLKQAAAALPVDWDELATLRALLAGRKIWLAASTHPGEETLVFQAHRALSADRPGLMTLIVPRHPERGGDLAAEAQAAGLKVAQRSKGKLPDTTTDVYLGDTLGELGLFYRLAPIALIGGSLVPHGGQNPLEAARLDCAMLIGPHTRNFVQATSDLIDRGAALRVEGAGELGTVLWRLFQDDLAWAAMAKAGREAIEQDLDVVEGIFAGLLPFLARQSAGPHAGP